MKKFLTVLLLLLVITGAAFYLYNTNTDFRNLIAQFMQQQQPTDTINTSPVVEQSPAVKKRQPRVPKAIRPHRFTAIDTRAKNTPKKYEQSMGTLVAYLTEGLTTDEEKIRSLFSWVAMHVKYNDAGFNSGNLGDCSAEAVFKTRKAVCEGYASLLLALCDTAGIEARKISGYAKGYGYTPGEAFKETDHAWNVIKMNGRWHLFDATWAAGYGQNIKGKLVSKQHFNPYWFDVPAKAFIFTHLPEEPAWQLTGVRKLSLKEYEKLPYVSQSFFELGFNPDEVFEYAATGTVTEFADIYSVDYPIKAVSIPYIKNLPGKSAVNFQLQSDYAEEIALVDGGNWHYFTKNGSEFTLKHQPQNTDVSLCVKINSFDRSYSTIVKYSCQNNKL